MINSPPFNENYGQIPVPPGWRIWFTKAANLVGSISDSGTTAERPTANLWVGRPYFDTTLGYIIHCKTVSPIVWVNGAGTAV